MISEKCPNCGKNAVERDQCQACGIVVSKWLKLHSAVPRDAGGKKDNRLPAQSSLPEPASFPFARKPAEDDKSIELEPPDFIFEKDATIPISDLEESPPQEEKGQPPAAAKSILPEPLIPEFPPKNESSGETPAEIPKSIFASTESELTELRKDLKTDWEDFYKQRFDKKKKEQKTSDTFKRFKVRNYLISAIMVAVSVFMINIAFMTKFGFTMEYGSAIPLINAFSLIGMAVAVLAILTLDQKKLIEKVKIMETEKEVKSKIPLSIAQMLEFVIIVILIILLPMAGPIVVRNESMFPIRVDVKEEYITGEGVGSYLKPVMGKDGKLYMLKIITHRAGTLTRMIKPNQFETVMDDLEFYKFRFIDKNKIITLSSDSLQIIDLSTLIDKKSDLDSIQSILPDYKISDFDISRDGKKLVFCADGDLYYSEDPFDSAQQLTITPNNTEQMPSIAPDGINVLFVRNIVSTDQMKKIAGSELGVDLNFSSGAAPDPRGHYQIFVVNLSSYSEQRITDDKFNYYYPIYTDDMSKICTVISTIGVEVSRISNINIYERAVVLMKPDATARVRIFPPVDLQLTAMEEMSWSPEGDLYIGINSLLDKGIYLLKFL